MLDDENHSEAWYSFSDASQRNHDYNPSWDYEVLDTESYKDFQSKLKIVANRILLQTQEAGLPGFDIFLSDKDTFENTCVGLYVDGTCNYPVFGISPKLICEYDQEHIEHNIETTLVHELAHALQEMHGLEKDEQEAENFIDVYLKTGFLPINFLEGMQMNKIKDVYCDGDEDCGSYFCVELSEDAKKEIQGYFNEVVNWNTDDLGDIAFQFPLDNAESHTFVGEEDIDENGLTNLDLKDNDMEDSLIDLLIEYRDMAIEEAKRKGINFEKEIFEIENNERIDNNIDVVCKGNVFKTFYNNIGIFEYERSDGKVFLQVEDVEGDIYNRVTFNSDKECSDFINKNVDERIINDVRNVIDLNEALEDHKRNLEVLGPR